MTNRRGVYVHIPFCLDRCHYCDFISYPLSGVGEQSSLYVEALLNEMKLQSKLLPRGRWSTLYLGGGTPTSLPATSLTRIIAAAKTYFPLIEGAEITVECNPATADSAYLSSLAAAGVNRLSVGAQSFRNDELSAMGRLHKAEDIAKVVYAAKDVGITNIGVDLIYGLPGQSLSAWQNNLEQAARLPIKHISLYSLDLNNQSVWGRMAGEGRLQAAGEDLSADMLEAAIAFLAEQGFRQYEIANFARTGFASRHNSLYWRRDDYLGLGLGSSSCFANRRRFNTVSLDQYISALFDKRLPPYSEEVLSSEVVFAEAVFLGLRLLDGVDADELFQRYGIDMAKRYAHELASLEKLGLLEHKGRCWRLTRRGLFLGNQVFMEFV